MDGQVVISAPPPSQSLSVATITKLQVLSYILLLFRTLFICVYGALRIHWSYENQSQSPFVNNGAFKIIGIVALSAVALVSIILWFTNTWLNGPKRHTFYTILKFVGSFSAFLAPFSLLMVLALPHKLYWIGYLLACVMFGMLVACFHLDDQQQNKGSSTFNNLVLVLVPLLILCVYFPKSIHCSVYLVIYVALVMENAYHFITYVMFITQKTRKHSNLEAHNVTQQNKTNHHPRNNYLQVLGRN